MSKAIDNQFVQYSISEEIANSVTHGLGTLLSIGGFVILLVKAVSFGSIWQVASCSIFGVTLILLYLASTLYHGSNNPTLKIRFKKLDHSAIFLLIAGTYTPFLLVYLRNPRGWTILAIIWTLAVCGVLAKLFFIQKFKKFSTAVYLGMGWFSLLALHELMQQLPADSIVYLFAGGIAYTVGVLFYTWKKLFFHHAVWHVFVMGGSILHYLSILHSLQARL